MINIEQTKESIISFLKENGPSLPVHISKHIKIEPMFASAILGELLNEKNIKTSDMRIGSSPLYLLPGQELELEKFTNNLTGTQKEVFLKLKDKKILQDDTQTPQFRVALRSLKDFAIPFKINETFYWKYLSTRDEEIRNILGKKQTTNPQIPEKKEENQKEIKQPIKIIEEIPEKEENNQENKIPEKKEKKLEPIFDSKPLKKPKSTTKNSEFLENVKEFLKQKAIELIYIEEAKKRQVIAKIKITHQNEKTDYLLIAYDKKRITEKDIFNAYKIALKSNLPYYILSKGETPKKIQQSIDAYKSLLDINQIE